MPEFNFNPALPLPIAFKIQEGQYGNQLNLFIPTESITHFIDHLQKLVDTKITRHITTAEHGEFLALEISKIDENL